MIKIRTAVEADIPAIDTLVNSAYRGESSRLGWTTEANFLEGQRTDPGSLEMILNNVSDHLFIGEENGELLCCACLSVLGKKASLGMITTRPDRQNQGLGKKMISYCEEQAQILGANSIEMSVINLRSEVISFYERRGYQSTGEKRPFPYGQEKFGLPMRRDLHFVILKKFFRSSPF